MYVIVEINGQQFKAEEGKKLFVHHIQNAENGATVEFEKVLLVDNNGTASPDPNIYYRHYILICIYSQYLPICG